MNKKALILSLVLITSPTFGDIYSDFEVKEVKDFKSMESFKSSDDFDKLISNYRKECMDVWAGSSGGASRCLNTEYGVWDRELNFYYKKLYKTLDKNGKKELKTSQKSWLKTRDSNSKFIYSLLNKATENKNGTMYGFIRASIGNDALMDSIKNRVITLKKWIPIIKDIKNIE